MKYIRLMAAALCAAFLLCGFSAPAYAYAEQTTGGYAESDPAPTGEDMTAEQVAESEPAGEEIPSPATQPGEGYAETGNLVTRDLLYDKHTNKQFITVQTANGSTFYLVIDYDKPVDADGEQYETYFLGMVDEADLLAALEDSGAEPPVCTCAEKCAAGAVELNCPVCAANMTACVGVAPEPEPVEQPEPEPQPQHGGAIRLLLALVVVLLGGGAGWYFKIYRPQQALAEQDDAEGDPEEDALDPYDGFAEDDGFYNEDSAEETEGKT